ncbi:class F sortase [Paenibacillus sp. GCM10023252]|uniref:class F sortase n=1 Tax=Paenibacillus sp. GCM10023252 TaxID=3252649 RepID=UPI00360A10C7
MRKATWTLLLAILLVTISACSSSAADPNVGGSGRPQATAATTAPTTGEDRDTSANAANATIPLPSPSPSPTPLTPPAVLKEANLGIVPAVLEIPAIGVKADVEQVGTAASGEMGVPASMDGVGWFEPGTKPGDRGNAVIAGHVDSKTGPAVFYKLDQLEKGDEVIVEDVHGKRLTFIVQQIESYPREAAPMEDIFGFSYQSQLNLITCTGEFNREAKTHDERLVVYTELKK